MGVRSRLAAVGLVCGVAACLVDVDYGGTRFRCGERGACPGGTSCVAGACEPIADADVSPDAPSPPPPADATSPDAAPPTCDELYGAAPEYRLCLEQPDRCGFNALTAGGTCAQLCAGFGGSCLGALDNENLPGVECTPIGEDACDTVRQSEICICSRP